MIGALAILGLMGGFPCLEPQQDNAWTEVHFHRVYLTNGAFIDGNLLEETPRKVTLQLKSGEISIRRDQVDRVELVKMRSFDEKPVNLLLSKSPSPSGPVPGTPNRLRPVSPANGPKAAVFQADSETKRKVDALLAELAHASAESKLALVDQLTNVGGDTGPYVASLLDRIDRSDLSVATAAIVKSKDPRAVPYLVDLTQNPEAILRTAAASGLGGLADERGIQPLIALLKDVDPTVKSTALGSLREMSDPSAFRSVLELMGSPDRAVRSLAIEVAKSLAGKLKLESDYADGLIDSASVAAKFGLINAVGKSKAKDKWSVIAGYLRDSEPQVRASAATALGGLGVPEASQPLASQASGEEDGRVKVQIALAAKLLHAKEVIESLIRWLQDPSAEVRAESVSSLQSLSGKVFGEDPARWEAWWAENRPK
jgi:HEAT repeat protein